MQLMIARDLVCKQAGGFLGTCPSGEVGVPGEHQRALLQCQSSAKVSTMHLLGVWGRSCCNLSPVWEQDRDSTRPAWQEPGRTAGVTHLTLTGAQIMVLVIPVLHILDYLQDRMCLLGKG